MKHCKSYYDEHRQVTIIYTSEFMTKMENLITLDINTVNTMEIFQNMENTLKIAKDLIGSNILIKNL